MCGFEAGPFGAACVQTVYGVGIVGSYPAEEQVFSYPYFAVGL